ncbi:MAG: DNA ligase, partial [Mesorhizobium sp.]
MRNAGDRLKFIKPLEPIQVETPPVSDDWLHEIKYDGFRTQLVRDWAGVRAF